MGRQRRARAPTRDPWVREAERTIGRRFRNPALLRSALTHPSVGAKGRAFERLEFLGDAILALVLALDLYRRYPHRSPGELTRLRASLVNRQALAQAATHLGVPAMLRMGKSEEPEGRRRATILAAAFEAIVAAVFLDRGLGSVTKFLRQHLLPRLSPDFSLDAKSELQACVQAVLKTLPRYRILKLSGLPHARRFEVEVKVKGQRLGTGKGGGRREAEQKAALGALTHLRENPHILRSLQG